MRDERMRRVLNEVDGKILDIGCGNNQLVRQYNVPGSIGVDVFDFGGGAMIVPNTQQLPFADKQFDTVTLVACLNHITERDELLNEVYRVLPEDGLVVMTMLTPLIGWLRHRLAWWDEDQNERGMAHEEDVGLSYHYVVQLFQQHGFTLKKCNRFILGLNRLYVFAKN